MAGEAPAGYVLDGLIFCIYRIYWRLVLFWLVIHSLVTLTSDVCGGCPNRPGAPQFSGQRGFSDEE